MVKIIILYTKQTLLFIFLISIFSCSKDTPEIVNEEELITTVELSFNTQGESEQKIRWETTAPNTAEIILKSNTEYEVQITFLDESDPGDIENINEEIIEEVDEHQVFFEFSGVTISYVQSDSDPLDYPSYADGMQVRDFIYVKDAVKIIIFFLNNNNFSGLYNAGTGNAETFKALAEALLINTKGQPDDIKYIEMPNDLKGKYQYYTQATMNKINSIGFNNNFMNLEEGVTDYLENFLLTSDRYA